MSRKGFTTPELLLVLALGAMLLSLVSAVGRRSLAARALDVGARELEGAVRLARQGAPNAGGAEVRFDAGPGSGGTWEVRLGPRTVLRRDLARDLDVTLSPASPPRIQFTSAGTMAADRNLTLASRTTGGAVRWRIHASTGSIERLP